MSFFILKRVQSPLFQFLLVYDNFERIFCLDFSHLRNKWGSKHSPMRIDVWFTWIRLESIFFKSINFLTDRFFFSYSLIDSKIILLMESRLTLTPSSNFSRRSKRYFWPKKNNKTRADFLLGQKRFGRKFHLRMKFIRSRWNAENFWDDFWKTSTSLEISPNHFYPLTK